VCGDGEEAGSIGMGQPEIASFPCRLCGTPVHGPQDGAGFKAGSYKFVVCLRCAPKVRAGAQVAKEAAVVGIKSFVAKKYPALLGLFTTYEQVHKEMSDGKQT
jgi:hypothetical protein